MQPTVLLACLCVCAAVLPALAQGNAAKACPYPPELISKALGQSFGAGEEEPGIAGGTGCRYRSESTSLYVIVSPTGGATPEQLRRMMNPRSTKWIPVAGDPDRAFTVVQSPDVPPFPSISYDRNGYVIDVHANGRFGGDAAAIAAVNAKLLKLPRIR